jgi:preprotein translocase subunit Sec63
LIFCSDLVLSLHQGVFGPLVYVGIHQKSCFKKVQMVLEKRKSFMQKVVQKKSLFRLRLRLFHAMLDVILIVCLVIFSVA